MAWAAPPDELSQRVPFLVKLSGWGDHCFLCYCYFSTKILLFARAGIKDKQAPLAAAVVVVHVSGGDGGHARELLLEVVNCTLKV